MTDETEVTEVILLQIDEMCFFFPASYAKIAIFSEFHGPYVNPSWVTGCAFLVAEHILRNSYWATIGLVGYPKKCP